MYDYDYDDKENGLSILDVLKVAFGTNKVSRIRFGAIVALVAVLIYLAVGVFYNDLKTNYVANFQYQIPSLIENKSNDGKIQSYSYLDGSPFNVNSLVTLDNLENVKKSNDKLSKVDINRIYDDSAFTISYNSDSQYQFSISINKKYFSNSEEAKLFVDELVKLPLAVTKDLVTKTDNSIYLKQAIDEDSTLLEEVNNLINQGKHILSTYKTMVENSEKTGLTFVTIDEKLYSLTDIMNVVSSKIDKLELEQLISEIESNHFIRNYDNEDVKKALETKRDNLQYESDQLSLIIDEYNAILTDKTAYSELEKFISYIDKKTAVDSELRIYQKYLSDGQDSKPIEPKITNAYNELKDLTDELNEVQKASYREDLTMIYFQKNSVVVEEGKINILISLALALVGGIVIAGVVNLILGVGKFKENKLESNTKNENPEVKE